MKKGWGQLLKAYKSYQSGDFDKADSKLEELRSHRESWIQHMVQVDRQEVEESLRASCGHGVAGVVSVRPRIGARGQATVGQVVQYALTR